MLSQRREADESTGPTCAILTLVVLAAGAASTCAEEMPQLERLYPDLEAAGIDLVGVSVDLESM